MPSQPTPPDSVPKYIAEGVPKQSDETLRELQSWIGEVLEYRSNITEDEIHPEEGEAIEDVEKTSKGTRVVKKVSCGKDNCRCASGAKPDLHGPYLYIVSRQGGKLVWDYKGPATE